MLGWLISLFAEHSAHEEVFEDDHALCPYCFREILMDTSRCGWCQVALESSESVSWRLDHDERFENRYGTFDVTAAKAIIASKRRPIMSINFHFGLTRPTEDDAPSDVPIICGGFAGDVLIIDGHKRFADAEEQGFTAIRAVFLTERETSRARIG